SLLTLPHNTHLPYTTLFRSSRFPGSEAHGSVVGLTRAPVRNEWVSTAPGEYKRRRNVCYQSKSAEQPFRRHDHFAPHSGFHDVRSEEHTYELQSRSDIVCRI